MPVIVFDNNWQGTDFMQGAAGVGTPNHESSLTAKEMEPLVLAVLNIQGMDNPPNIMPEELRKLSEALRSPNAEIVVRKGIHQRDTAIHFTINVKPSFCSNFHVYVRQGAAVVVPTAAFPANGKTGTFAGLRYLVNRYNYVPSGITFEDEGRNVKSWPAAFIQEGGARPGLPRGTSLSIGNRQPQLDVARSKEVDLYSAPGVVAIKRNQ
jgi:hypothetical protein